MQTVHNLIILDASGSMQSIYNQNVEEEAAKMGIRSSLQFQEDAAGTEAMFAQERKSRKKFFRRLKDNFHVESMLCEIDYFED